MYIYIYIYMDIERISTRMLYTCNHHSRVITQNQETVAMTSNGRK